MVDVGVLAKNDTSVATQFKVIETHANKTSILIVCNKKRKK